MGHQQHTSHSTAQHTPANLYTAAQLWSAVATLENAAQHTLRNVEDGFFLAERDAALQAYQLLRNASIKVRSAANRASTATAANVPDDTAVDCIGYC